LGTTVRQNHIGGERKPPVGDPAQGAQIHRLSPSDLNQFFSCPLQWKFRREGRVGIAVDDRTMLLGSNIHHMITMYFQRISDRPTAAEVKRIAENVWEEGFDEQNLRTLKRRGERCWQNFVRFELERLRSWRTYKPTLVEAKLSNDVYVGIVDFHSDPQRTTVDWKTGGLDQIGKEEMRQGKIYKILLEDNGYQTDRVLFVALQTGRVLEMPMVTRGWLDRESERMVGMVRRGQFPRNPGPRCGYCPYILDCEFLGVCLWV